MGASNWEDSMGPLPEIIGRPLVDIFKEENQQLKDRVNQQYEEILRMRKVLEDLVDAHNNGTGDVYEITERARGAIK